MRFAEEVLLLLLNEETGYFIPIPEWSLSCVLAGGVLIDLSLENRIDSDLQTLTLLDPTPTGDELLDPVLEEIVADTRVHSPQYWVERIARRSDEISDMALHRLVKIGVLNADSGGFWSLSGKVARSRRYPTVDGKIGEEVKSRIMRALLDDEIPDPRDFAIIGLMNSCGGIRAMLEPEEYELAEDRIKLFSGMDLIGRTIGAAVLSSYRPPSTIRSVQRPSFPVIGPFGMLASRTFRSGNIPKFLAEKSQELGPIFRIKAPGRDMIVFASAELNRWVGHKGRLYLRTRDYLEDFQQEWGTARSIASLDGADHFRMRKAVQAGNSRAVVEDRLGEVLDLGRRTFANWGIGKTVSGETACQRMIGEQIAQLSVSIEPSDILDDLIKFEYRVLLVHLYRLLPKFTLRTPAMKRAHARVHELYTQIHATHTPAQREGKRRDLVDDLMALHQSDPQFLPETDLGFAFIAPIIAGHYLGSAMAFAIYELLVNPDLRDQIAAEADTLFADRDPVGADLNPQAFDVTRRFVMETLRRYPVVPIHVRTAMNAFEVEGMEIPAYSTVLVAFSSVHYNEKHFKDPDTFDIDRYTPPRNEHKQASGIYVPFGVGTHMCGGARWTELQIAVNLLLIARHLELEMVPANYKLKINPLPKLSPNKNFRFRIVRYRHPIEAVATA